MLGELKVLDLNHTMNWYELNQKWHQMRYAEPSDILDAYKQDLVALIYDLPEFRLYDVTGMLRKDDLDETSC